MCHGDRLPPPYWRRFGWIPCAARSIACAGGYGLTRPQKAPPEVDAGGAFLRSTMEHFIHQVSGSS